MQQPHFAACALTFLAVACGGRRAPPTDLSNFCVGEWRIDIDHNYQAGALGVIREDLEVYYTQLVRGDQPDEYEPKETYLGSVGRNHPTTFRAPGGYRPQVYAERSYLNPGRKIFPHGGSPRFEVRVTCEPVPEA